MESPHRRSYRLPKQQRSRATFDRIVDTVERMIQTRPFRTIAIDDICAEAGVSQSSFYARFPDREALAEALADRYADRVRESVERTQVRLLSEPDLTVERAVKILIRGYHEFIRDTTTLRLTVEEDAATHRRLAPTDSLVLEELAKFAEVVVGPLDREHLQQLQFVSIICAGALSQWVGGYVRPLQREWWSDERFESELARMVVAYLAAIGLVQGGEGDGAATAPPPSSDAIAESG
jgi:AcrR family transcriptional regulator